MERRLSKKDLMELYGVDRVTIEDWRRNRGLKMIEVSTHSIHHRRGFIRLGRGIERKLFS